MKNKLILLITIISIQNCIGQQLSLTFKQTYQICMEKNHGIKQTSYQTEYWNEELKAAKGLYFPKIGITGNFMRLSDELHLDLTSVKDAITPLYKSLGSYGNFSIAGVPDNIANQMMRSKILEGLNEIEKAEWDQLIQEKQLGSVNTTLDWTVYAGGKIRIANNVAQLRYQEAQTIENTKQYEIFSEVSERYFGLCLAKQYAEVRKEVLNAMEKHLNDAIKMEKEGLIANIDVLNIKVYHSQAERELKQSQSKIEIVNNLLNNTLSSDKIDSEIEPLSQLFYIDSLENVNYFKQMALKNNNIIKQIELNKKMAEESCKSEKANYLPAIAINGSYEIADYNVSEYMPEWMIGVGLKWTLFDGTTRLRKYKAASIKVKQIDEFQLKTTNDILSGVEKIYHELQTNYDLINDLKTAQKYAEENVLANEKKFKEEMVNSTQLIDARLALSKIKIEKLDAVYKYDICLAKMAEITNNTDVFFKMQNNPKVIIESYK